LLKATTTPRGFLSFTLNAHLPYVVNHGTWPHGLEWLHEAAAETYLPLLRMMKNLERDGLALKCNLNLSPILLEQLAHPIFRQEFPRYLERKTLAAREDEAYFTQAGESHFASTARYWQGFFHDAAQEFAALGGDIAAGFKHFHQTGQIELISSGATHGYMPLLGTDESVRAQIRTGVAVHKRHFGFAPRGIWATECGYRPAGLWQCPVTPAGAAEPWPPSERIGVEQAFAESGLEYFFVDTHLVEEGKRSPAERNPNVPVDQEAERVRQSAHRLLYQPYYVDGPYGRQRTPTVFARDPRTGVQVWSGDTGYPGDFNYLDFHKKRWPGGHRYWQVTGDKIDMSQKTPYYPRQALERVKIHADHFVQMVAEALNDSLDDPIPPILTSPFDAELFGHWWYEGVMWLEAVVRAMARQDLPLALTTCGEYLELYPRAGFIAMQEGSWGAEGSSQVWMNPDTSWTYTHIYQAEAFTRDVATAGKWKDGGLGERIVKQLCRELLLLESSDWQFLITTGAARDYAETRFLTHNDQFQELANIWQSFTANGSISEAQEERLAAIELRDSIFADINPAFWALDAKEPAKA
jgi:1,4-alpha-glucan branching enzyme